MTPLMIAAAGGLGAATRLVVDGLVRHRVSSTFPWATVLINVTGSFLLGLLVGLGAGDRWQDVLGTGFLGGYTTFSAASLETAGLVLDRRPLAAAVNGLGVLVACVAAAACGYALVGI
ncbi:fluoride efflux transporter FluC [Aeromicrobium sp.]|uniref:fluoride efflux transporter FluC n=1 Tax=Aeromicrobium sp. TaxID=1871063 RepID=UPI003C3E5A8B